MAEGQLWGDCTFGSVVFTLSAAGPCSGMAASCGSLPSMCLL